MLAITAAEVLADFSDVNAVKQPNKKSAQIKQINLIRRQLAWNFVRENQFISLFQPEAMAR